MPRRPDNRILLRGVYFSSGTQEGTPIDRLLGAIGRGFRVAPEAVQPGGRGKAYFVERLLTQVLIGESGLAGVNRQFELRKAAAQLGVYAALIVLTVFGVMALSMSYRRNAAYLASVERDVALLRQIPATRDASSVQGVLPRLDALRAIVDAADRHSANVPWGMRWGLYQGRAIGNAARDAYMLELDASFLPYVARLFQQRLRQYGREPEKLYEYLKAYLMLAQPEHLDKKHLQYLASLEWSPGSGVRDAAGASLTRHFQTLLDSEERLRPVSTDAALVAQACNTVRQASLGRIMYGWLKETYATDESHQVRLDVAAGVAAAQTITRRSGTSLAEPIPSLYSRSAFEQITGGDMPQLVEQFAKDNWVCNRGGDLGDRARLQADLTNIYQQDYIATWEKVLDDLVIVSPATVSAMADLLGVLGSPTSPLRNLLQVVTENTYLVQPAKPATAEEGGALAKGRSYADRLSTMFSRAPVAASAATPGALVTARFQDIHRLFAGEPGNAPIDGVQKRFLELEQQLRALGSEYGQQPVSAAQRSPQLRDLYLQLDRQADALPSPVRELVEQIGSGVQQTVNQEATSELAQSYRSQVVGECARVIAGRYPFTPGSRTDLPLTEFSRVFGPGGVFDKFFTERLQERVDTSTRPWSWRPGLVAPYPGMLSHFESARAIRDTFFPSGPQPELRFSVTILSVDAAATRFTLDIDGQKFEDRRGGKAPATWPGQNAGAVSASFEDRTGVRSGVGFDGPWALFRLIDASQPRHAGETQTTLTFRGRSHEASVLIEATSLSNPFARREWQRFECGS